MATLKRSILAASACVVLAAFSAYAQSTYAETINVMQAVLTGELAAHVKYGAYAKKAREERYARLGYLAAALSASEGIHARNFQDVLIDLGAAADLGASEVIVADTRTNLKNASTAELEEIDTKYPRYIQRITPEKCAKAISVLTYAWKAEKQHRDLISQIIAGSGIWFGVLVKEFENHPVDYFVCQGCGSTLIELPKDKCPICLGSVSRYEKVDPDS